jgi:hypothetical protein
MNSYKRVQSYGRYLTNNLNLQKESQGKYWRDAKYSFFSKVKHKYCICFEHSSYPYYCTEKLMDSFLAGSVPIYLGDPKINSDWNKESFINVGRIGTEETMKLIKDMEYNNELFLDVYSKPIFTDEQKKRHLDNMNNFEMWLINKIIK